MLFFSLSKTQDGNHLIFSEVRFLSQQIRLKDAKEYRMENEIELHE